MAVPFSLSSRKCQGFSGKRCYLLSVLFPCFRPSIPTCPRYGHLSKENSIYGYSLVSQSRIVYRVVQEWFRVYYFFSRLIRGRYDRFVAIDLFHVFFYLVGNSYCASWFLQRILLIRVRIRSRTGCRGLGVSTLGVYSDLYRCSASFLSFVGRVVGPFGVGLSSARLDGYSMSYRYYHDYSRRAIVCDSL